MTADPADRALLVLKYTNKDEGTECMLETGLLTFGCGKHAEWYRGMSPKHRGGPLSVRVRLCD